MIDDRCSEHRVSYRDREKLSLREGRASPDPEIYEDRKIYTYLSQSERVAKPIAPGGGLGGMHTVIPD